ncbi:hypothetical protein F4810DRAFT_652182 [Camillea tinctor]|nr:hypothetical protein F4810DRAFT_652182 [Camillea tinctor]
MVHEPHYTITHSSLPVIYYFLTFPLTTPTLSYHFYPLENGCHSIWVDRLVGIFMLCMGNTEYTCLVTEQKDKINDGLVTAAGLLSDTFVCLYAAAPERTGGQLETDPMSRPGCYSTSFSTLACDTCRYV